MFWFDGLFEELFKKVIHESSWHLEKDTMFGTI